MHIPQLLSFSFEKKRCFCTVMKTLCMQATHLQKYHLVSTGEFIQTEMQQKPVSSVEPAQNRKTPARFCEAQNEERRKQINDKTSWTTVVFDRSVHSNGNTPACLSGEGKGLSPLLLCMHVCGEQPPGGACASVGRRAMPCIMQQRLRVHTPISFITGRLFSIGEW